MSVSSSDNKYKNGIFPKCLAHILLHTASASTSALICEADCAVFVSIKKKCLTVNMNSFSDNGLLGDSRIIGAIEIRSLDSGM